MPYSLLFVLALIFVLLNVDLFLFLEPHLNALYLFAVRDWFHFDGRYHDLLVLSRIHFHDDLQLTFLQIQSHILSMHDIVPQIVQTFKVVRQVLCTEKCGKQWFEHTFGLLILPNACKYLQSLFRYAAS